MKVLFDTSALHITKTGVANYITELINAFYKSDLPIEVRETSYKPKFGRNTQLRVLDTIYRDVVWPSRRLKGFSRKTDNDLLHCPAFNFPLLQKKRLLITIHDLYSIAKPTNLKLWHGQVSRTYISNAINWERQLLVLTEFTRMEILNYFPKARPENIHVVYSGVPDVRVVNNDPVVFQRVQNKYSINRPYILSVSTIEPRKNFYNLIKAFKILSNKIDHTLVLVGQCGWNNKEVYELIKRYNLQNRVCFTGFVSDDELNSLYTNAQCFVFPSFYEGFGFTPLEAMKCSCPVVSSNASCMPEVLGDAAMYFNPNDVDSMANAIHQMLIETRVNQRFRKLGVDQAGKYNWTKTAIETYGVYQKILENKL